jgi:arylamine N-acetyltransferase
MPSAPVFTQPEIDAFLDRIQVPEETRRFLKSPGGGKNGLQAITTLQQRTMIAIPFENTSLHYAPYQLFELDAKPLFRKIVQRNEGGACFQVTRLFLHMVRSMGFQCYPTYGRININLSAAAAPGAKGSLFGEWAHMLVVVTISGTNYVVDPCFGPNMPTRPVALIRNDVQPDTPGRERQLAWDNIDQNTDANQRYWIMQFRAAAVDGGQPGKWTDAYCFRENECLMSDFDTVHMSCRFGRKAWFMSKVMAFRWIEGPDGTPCGWYLMWENQLRKNWMGKVSLIETFARDQDRVAAIEKYFNIQLDPEDVEQIVGTVSYLKPLPLKPAAKKPAAEQPAQAAKEKTWLHQGMMGSKL